jgi:cyanophycin synthetase
MFPPGEDGRIPIVAVTGVNGKTTTTRLVAHIVRETGVHLGMTCTDGIYVDGRRIEVGDCSGPKSARMVLLNPKVEAAVFEVARGGILREGLGFDRCRVAVVTNIGEGDHLGLGDIHTLEKLALVKRTPVDVVLPEGTAVLNAADPWVAGMAPKCRGAVTFFAPDETAPVLAEHRAQGKRAAFVRDDAIVLAEGERETVLADLKDVPLTMGGRVKFQVENVLAASAAAWALGVPFEIIRRALASFTSDMRQVPGRFNILHVRGATVVVDFGHNPSALLALTESLGQFPHERRTVVFSADGDRGDDAILRQAEIIGNTIDRVILYEEECRNRGRRPGEIFALIKRGLALGSRTSEVIDAEGELGAIRLALDTVRPGDLLLVLHDAVESSLAFIQNYLATQAPRRDSRESGSAPGQQGCGLLTTPAVSGDPS